MHDNKPIAFIYTGVALLLVALPASSAQAVGMRVRGSDTELRLVRHDISVELTHPLAVVRVIEEFENPLPRALEADYTYRLPPGATIDDLGLWVNGVRRPARMLERQQAKEIYEGIVRQKRDPALVERTASGLYRVRIFPVLAKARTRIELRYTQLTTLVKGGQHRLRLHHQGRVPLRISGHLSALGGAKNVRFRGYGAKPVRDREGWRINRRASAEQTEGLVDLEYWVDPNLAQALVQKRKGKRYLLASIPRPATRREHVSTAFLLDTSRSMAEHWSRVPALVRAIDSGSPFPKESLLITLQLRPRVLSAKQLEQLSPAGGSALLPAFERARDLGARHLVLITDSPRKGSQAEFEHLARRAYDRNQLATQERIRISVIQMGKEERSRASLEQLAKASGGIFRVAPEKNSEMHEVGRAIHEPRAPLLRSSSGHKAHLIRADSTRLVVAMELAAEDGAALTMGEMQIELDPRAVDHGPATLWGAAQIGSLMQRVRLFGQEEPLRRRIVALSKELRVASEYTALLVTEKDADYDRPTSGRTWQRRVHRMGEGVPAPMSYHATPEPHEWAMIALALAMVFASRRRGLRGAWRRGRREV